MDDEFKLCWKNFQDNIASGFQNLYDRGDLVDVTLACDGKLLHAHKIVLAICSPYFQEIFITNPCKHPIIILKDVTFNIMCELLEFMYQGVVNVKHTELQSFMKIGQLLQIKGLATNASAASASAIDTKVSSNNNNSNNESTPEVAENEGNNSPKNSDNSKNNNNTNNDNKNEDEEENSNSNNNNNNKPATRSPATSPTPMIFGPNFKHFNDNNLSLSLSSYSQSHHHHSHQLRHHHHQIGGSMKRQYSSLSEFGGGDGGLSIYSRNKLRKSLSIADQSSSCGGENDVTSAASSDIGGNNTTTLHSSTTNISHNNNNNNTSMEQVNVEDIFLSAMPHIPIIDSKYDLSGVKRESGGNNNNNNNNNNDPSTSRNSFANNPYSFDYNIYKNNNVTPTTTTATSSSTANTTEYPNELHMPSDYSKNFGNHMDIPAIAPGEHWFQGKLEFMLSQRGKPLLVHDGHTFGIQYVRKDKKYWQCNLSRKFNCKARVTTTDTGEIIVTNNEHCHTEIRQHLRKDYQRNKVMMNALLNLSSMRRHSVGNLNSLSNLKQCLPSMLAVAEHCSEPSILDLAKASNITTTTNTTCTEDIETRNSSTDDYTAHDLSRTAAKIENEFIRQHKHDNDEDSDNDSPLDCGMRGTSTSDF